MSFRLSLSDCEAALSATLVGDDLDITGVSIDTRTLAPGDLYVAIHGERFNGHEFVGAAEQAGARAILVHEQVVSRLPQLQVANTQVALGELGRMWAKRFQVPTIAITGSNGKTTVKEIIATILRQLGPVLSTKGNLNNEIGVPLTLLGMRPEHRYAVIEMGASRAGDISKLVRLVQPDVALVNNISAAHLEGFGSMDAIARAKAEIYTGLMPDGWAVINADDAYAPLMRKAASHCHTREFGVAEDADVRGVPGTGLNIHTCGRKLSPRFPLAGDHNGRNALAAVAAVQCLDVQPATIVRGLENVRPVPGRLERRPGFQGATLIDDSYNANPVSVKSAIDVLATYPGRRYLVLGDMAELGAEAETLHARVGTYAKSSGIDGLWTTGVLASGASKAFARSAKIPSVKTGSEASGEHAVGVPVDHSKGASLAGAGVSGTRKAQARHAAGSPGNVPLSAGGHFTDQESLIQDLRKHLSSGVTVLIKGSRSARMERVINGLLPKAAQKPLSSKTPAVLLKGKTSSSGTLS